jgi:hypothetical protein
VTDELTPATDPLAQRAAEIHVAAEFLGVLEERLGQEAAEQLFAQAVTQLAQKSAAQWRERYPEPSLSDLWEVWCHLGGEGRLDLHLDELTRTSLRFHVDRCAYAELYRSLGLERAGVAFSCRRDAPFAEALIPGVSVTQSRTILEGAPRCEFTYTLEDR